MFRRTILQIGYLFIPTQTVYKKNSLAAVSALMFFFLPRAVDTIVFLRSCYLITHPSLNVACKSIWLGPGTLPHLQQTSLPFYSIILSNFNEWLDVHEERMQQRHDRMAMGISSAKTAACSTVWIWCNHGLLDFLQRSRPELTLLLF